jgi:hypothetical protein
VIFSWFVIRRSTGTSRIKELNFESYRMWNSFRKHSIFFKRANIIMIFYDIPHILLYPYDSNSQMDNIWSTGQIRFNNIAACRLYIYILETRLSLSIFRGSKLRQVIYRCRSTIDVDKQYPCWLCNDSSKIFSRESKRIQNIVLLLFYRASIFQ